MKEKIVDGFADDVLFLMSCGTNIGHVFETPTSNDAAITIRVTGTVWIWGTQSMNMVVAVETSIATDWQCKARQTNSKERRANVDLVYFEGGCPPMLN
jgi:hypothetical protein